jgi:methyltransferase
VGEGGWLLAFITLQRAAELAFARRNDARLFACGGVEFGRAHYPAMVALHAAWLAGLWVIGRARAVELNLLAVFAVVQAARLWTVGTLGERWTTRVIVLPGARLLARGPYRFMRHPNYLIVAVEIALVPLALGLPLYAAVFSLLNAALLIVRLQAEEAALQWAVNAPADAAPRPGVAPARDLAKPERRL